MSCKSDALKMVARKSYHSQELTRKLQAKGHPLEEIQEVITYLQGLGYLDDAQYLESFSKKAIRSGWGPLEVRAKLYAKGITDQPEFDQEEAFATCLRKKRTKGTLYRKGFSSDLINSSLRDD